MRGFTFKSLAVHLLIGGALISCAEAPMNSDGFDVDVSPRLRLVEELRIGSIEDPNYGFTRIGGVDVDDLGNIYVFEEVDHQIRVYSESGDFLRTIGGRGQGPGEFALPSLRFGLAGDTLWTWNGMGHPSDGGRVTLFTTDGRLLGTSRLQSVQWYDWNGNCSAIIPEISGTDGYIIGGRGPGVTTASFCPPRPNLHLTENSTVTWPYVRFGTDGSIVDTVGHFELEKWTATHDSVRVGRYGYPAAAPPSDKPTHVTFSGGVYRLERPVTTNPSSGHFSVTRLTFGGDTVFSHTHEYTPHPYSAAVLDTIAASYAPRTGWFQESPNAPAIEVTARDSIAAQAAIRQAMSFPPFQPPIQGTHVGRDGTLWLRREDTGEPAFRWLLFDSTGILRGEVELPRYSTGILRGELELPRSSIQILWSRNDHLLTIETDDLGVPWLVRYRLE